MDPNVSPTSSVTPAPEVTSPAQTPPKPKSKAPLLLTIWGVLLALVAGVSVFNYTKQASKNVITKSTSVPTTTPTAIISPASKVEPSVAITGTQTYTDPQGRFTFQYHKNWTPVNSFPDQNFPPHTETACRGIILINNIDTKNKNTIAIDLDKVGSDGGWCFSAGSGSWEAHNERYIEGYSDPIQVAKRVNFDANYTDVYADSVFPTVGGFVFGIEADYRADDANLVQHEFDTILKSLKALK